MGFEQYLNLLNSLQGSALNIWGFLLTVSLGIIAFLGSTKSINIPLAFVLCALFLGFSQSNYTALKRNFDQRIAIVTTVHEIAKNDSKFNKILVKNARIIDKFEVKKVQKEISLIFQVFVSFLVASIMLSWPIYLARLTRKSTRT
jgi:hypothetical protein